MDGRGQDDLVGREPFESVLPVAELLTDDAALRPGEGDRFPRRFQQACGQVSGVQVVVEEPVGGGVSLIQGLFGVGEVDGVGAEQVVQAVSAGCGFVEQVRSRQFGY